MRRERPGEYYVTGQTEKVRAFIPAGLPPDPPLAIGPDILLSLADASWALGRLNSLRLAFDRELLLYQYVRKEAVLSSQIEGTQSTLDDLLRYEDQEIPGVPLEDVEEVSRYVKAAEHGMTRMQEEGFPLSSRLIKELHTILLSSGRGSTKMPGEYKRSQNWLGGTRPGNAEFVPTPPHEVDRCMGELEKFIHQDESLPAIIKAGLAHVQFETIHPFLDGNGRIGRLLIPLLLMEKRVLDDPILYLSLYFKTHRSRYYELLQGVQLDGDWEAWTVFYLEGVMVTALDAVAAAENIHAIFQRDRVRIRDAGKDLLGVRKVHEALMIRQASSPKRLATDTGLSYPSVMSALRALVDLGILKETTGKPRSQWFVYEESRRVLTEGLGQFAAEGIAPSLSP